VYSNIDELKE
jgi:hypothetical protein